MFQRTLSWTVHQQGIKQTHLDADTTHHPGPWLCYGRGSGFGGYCSYGGKRLHRRTRVWELETSTGSLKTWTRLEYAADRVDELVLVISGVVVEPPGKKMSSATDDLTCVGAHLHRSAPKIQRDG
ncbi:hypothetical protein N7467_011777 [Penicillium canescens]|nr:hypothetical protein N7467_011777 [Penicillium canescens]